jgi:predicted RNA-binding Zn ribbon-like protein
VTQPIPTYVFELDAGVTCLDFANTLTSDSDHLNSYADLVAFAEQARLITPEQAARLRADAGRDPHGADGVLVRAKWLRQAIRGIFDRLAAGETPRELDLDMLNRDLAESMEHARVLPGHDGSYMWGWSGRGLDMLIWPITRSAAELLTSDEQRPLVRECGASDCLWLFLDTSKNRSRQWCSMQSCGNREKARRHYQRLRERRDVSPASGADARRGSGRARRTPATPADDASARAV